VSILNGYVTLAEFKAYITPPNQTLNPDTVDDAFIEDLIEIASRRVDDLLGRTFWPRIETYYYDIPKDNTIWFGDDVLRIISFKNGDATAITSTDYILKPYNVSPKYCLELRDTSSVVWVTDSSNNSQQVLTLVAEVGFHEWYDLRAWMRAGTLAAAIADATTLTATLTAGHTLAAGGGQIIKIDNEIFNTASVATNTLTVLARGDNGSTAIAHLINSVVYVWKHMDPIKKLAMGIARIDYGSRFGENIETTAITTPAGVVITPRSLPISVPEIIRKYGRIV